MLVPFTPCQPRGTLLLGCVYDLEHWSIRVQSYNCRPTLNITTDATHNIPSICNEIQNVKRPWTSNAWAYPLLTLGREMCVFLRGVPPHTHIWLFTHATWILKFRKKNHGFLGVFWRSCEIHYNSNKKKEREQPTSLTGTPSQISGGHKKFGAVFLVLT